ncbi:MAG TPA: PQQ-binding-like beta-propeller repeat protein [Treponema sp.]|nr:PQQ-binding-like beta-propeller repeat protein [Treponema sp.]
MNRLIRLFVTSFVLCSAFVLFMGCPSGKKDSNAPQTDQDFSQLISSEETSEAQTDAETPASIQPVLVFLQGSVSIQRSGKALSAAEGLLLEAGDIISTGNDGSAEIAYGSFATLRLFPRTTVSLSVLISRAIDHADRDVADLSLLAGTVAAKVKKLASRDEFLVLTPNSAAGVRGTQFVVSYEEPIRNNGTISRTERTLVAVREGAVAVLPKGKLLSSLIDGRQANPLAGAVVATALALAPKAGPGQEITVGGRETAAGSLEDEDLLHSAETAYGALVRQAEEFQARGTDFEAVQDPVAVLAIPDSEIERSFAKLSRTLPALLLSEQSRFLLDVLDRMREPGGDTSILPAGLPERYFIPKGNTGEKGDKKTSVQPQNPPGLVYTVPLSSVALTGMISRSGDTILLLDSKGNLYGIDQGGTLLWSQPALVTFTALDASVALVESQNLKLVEAKKGTVKGTYSFNSWQALPQAKPVPIPNGIALATPRGVTILRQENAEVMAEIPVLGGVIAPLVLADSQLLAVSGQGRLVFIDIKSGRISDEIALDLKADVLTPRVKDNRAYIATKGGRLLAIDVAAYRMLWDIQLEQGIGSEPELDGDRIYLWLQDKTLASVSVNNGSFIGKPIPDVQSPPLLSKGRLYWGGSGPSLVVADAATGTILKRSPLPDMVSARPLFVDGTIYLGTKGGKFIRIDTDKL